MLGQFWPGPDRRCILCLLLRAAHGHLVEALKPGVLTPSATPIKVQQGKRKLFTYLRCSGVPTWADVSDQHSVFFGCMESSVEDKVMHHVRYSDRAAVLSAEPRPDGDLLVELLDPFAFTRPKRGSRWSAADKSLST